MAAEVIRCPEPSRAQAPMHTVTLATHSLWATKQPRSSRLAAYMVDKDAPFGEQPPVNRIQDVLSSVIKVEAHLTKQTKPVNDIFATIASLALRNGYAAILHIISASNGQSHGGRGSRPSRSNSGGTGQITSGSTAPLGAGNGGGGPSKPPMKRGAGGDDEGNPNKKKKLLNEQKGSDEFHCIVFVLSQRPPNHLCRDKKFATLDGAINHYLRIHVGHLQCPKCLIRKGTATDMNKHTDAGCTPPARIRDAIKDHAENVRKVKTWDGLREQVAPTGEIQYDMASDIDKLPRPLPDEDKDLIEQLLASMGLPGIPAPECDPIDSFPPALNDPYVYPPWNQSGIGHDLSALSTVNPQDLLKSNPDSGFSPSTKWGFEVHRHQYSEMRNETSTGGGVTIGNGAPGQGPISAKPDIEVLHRHYNEMQNQTSTGGGGVTSGNEAPDQDPSYKFLKRVNGIVQAFQEDNRMARLYAENIAISAPVSILRVFAEAYQLRVGREREMQAHNPSPGAKGKEEERHHGVADRG